MEKMTQCVSAMPSNAAAAAFPVTPPPLVDTRQLRVVSISAEGYRKVSYSIYSRV